MNWKGGEEGGWGEHDSRLALVRTVLYSCCFQSLIVWEAQTEEIG